MGSERGDGYKKPGSLGEGTGTKVSDNSEAPQRATASRLVPTHQADLKLTRFRGARQAFNGGFSDAQDASALFT
jgi:hypothetical protein